MRRLRVLLALGIAALPCCGGDGQLEEFGAGASDVAAAREPGADDARAQGRWPVTIELPLVATAGELPPAAERMDVGVDAAGAITVNGEPTDLAGLYPRLQQFAQLPAGEVESDSFAVIALDASLPWIVGMRCQCRCSWAGIRRTFFAVRDPEGRLGALAAFVPRAHAGRFAHYGRFLRVLVDESGTPARPSDVAAELRSALGDGDDVGVIIDAAPSAPVGLVLTLLGAAAETGVHTGGFVIPWGPFPDGEPSDDVQRFAASDASNHASIGEWKLLGVEDSWPPPAELTARYVGLFAHGSAGSTLRFPGPEDDR